MRSGFTLIELSIVLVVIGLIVGGVLVGRELIEQSRIRAQITQIEQLRTAVTTFRIKYNNFPGDITASQANALAFATRSGAGGRGNGDGQIGSCSMPTWSHSSFGCENALFWNDLSVSKLLAGTFIGGDSAVQVANNRQNNYFPASRLGNNIQITVFNQFWVNPSSLCKDKICFSIVGVTSTNASGNYTTRPSTSAYQAFAIDSKMDDGFAYGGNAGGFPFLGDYSSVMPLGTWSANDCTITGTNGEPNGIAYNFSDAGNNAACAMIVGY